MFIIKEGSSHTDNPLFLTISNDSTSLENNQIMFFPERIQAQAFYENCMPENNLIKWIYDELLQTDKVFVDIGAHIGTYTWTCAKKAYHTYSFECNPQAFCYLAANIALNKLEFKTNIYNCALGNEEKVATYYIRSNDGGGNGVKVLSELDNSLKKIDVQMKTLDSFNITNIGLIKIDVEGFEKEVLEGSINTLKNNNFPKIIFESWTNKTNNAEINEISYEKIQYELFEYVKSLGYTITKLINVQDMYLAIHD